MRGPGDNGGSNNFLWVEDSEGPRMEEEGTGGRGKEKEPLSSERG